MERVNLGYSTKNIAIPKRNKYLKCLLRRTENFLRAVRWRTFFYLNPDIKTASKENYGFNSTKSPPRITELKQFEDGLLSIIQNIKFRYTPNTFQQQLANDVSGISNSDKLLVPADKTTNYYKTEVREYVKQLDDNISTAYKKSDSAVESEILHSDAKIAVELDLADRIDTMAKKEAFITFKDHKPGFLNNPKCRLINPTKSEIGIISKRILDRIIPVVKNTARLNSWINSNEVIDWFKQSGCPQYSFICFDVCDFYPSINQELLTAAISFASQFTHISQQEKEIIFHAKKSLLYNNSTPWCKRGDNPNFDVTMGSFDGAETCQLIGLYLLSDIQNTIPNINVGIYRDDGLAISRSTPRLAELTKKKLCSIFHRHGLKITIEANQKRINFLDLTLNMTTMESGPYIKPGNNIVYVNRKSNHPPVILKNIPVGINQRLSNISSNATIFDRAIQPYQQALLKSGYDFKLQYSPAPPRSSTKKRRRNILWYNPPYSQSVSTNVGKKFLSLLDRCFPRGHLLHKILNRNTVKISFSCMPNISHTIAQHNKKLLRDSAANQTTPQRNCNCRGGIDNCPLNGECLTKSIVYQATVVRADNSAVQTYIGHTANSFKSRYSSHLSSFNHANHKTATTLSQYIWKLKDDNITYSISWKIVALCQPYAPTTKHCNLCITEKFFIIYRDGMATLNSRNELMNACRHRRRFLLANAIT